MRKLRSNCASVSLVVAAGLTAGTSLGTGDEAPDCERACGTKHVERANRTSNTDLTRAFTAVTVKSNGAVASQSHSISFTTCSQVVEDVPRSEIPVYFPAMADRDEKEHVLLKIKAVNDSIIANAQPAIGGAFQPMVWKTQQLVPSSEILSSIRWRTCSGRPKEIRSNSAE